MRFFVHIVLGLVFVFSSTSAMASDSGKSMNFRFSPLGLLIGYVNVDLDWPVNENWTVGPTFSYWTLKMTSTGFNNEIKATVYSLGARANWYKNGNYTDGLYISPILQYVSASASTTGSSNKEITATASVFGLTGLIGYHWFWDSFNLSLGAGPAVSFGGSSKAKVEDGSSSAEVNTSNTAGLGLDFMMGFTF